MFLSESLPGEKCISAVAAPRGLAMLQNEGKRVLACSFCRHEWSANRIFCPFCENTASDMLQYFVVQDDDEHRVDVCENCKRFIKTVDLRKISRIIYPPLEQVATLHLDMKAAEAGYVSGLGISV
jgi:FdhE protein